MTPAKEKNSLLFISINSSNLGKLSQNQLTMKTKNPSAEGKLMHVVTLECKDSDHARRCLDALANYGKPDALSFNCLSYEFGLKEGTADTVYLVERWSKWQDLDALLTEKVVPALPLYNQLLKHPFDPGKNTLRINLSDV